MTFFGLLIFFGSLAIAWDQFQKSIAKRTADEIERRSKPPEKAPPTPKPGLDLSLREGLTIVGLVLGLFAFIAVFGQYVH